MFGGPGLYTPWCTAEDHNVIKPSENLSRHIQRLGLVYTILLERFE